MKTKLLVLIVLGTCFMACQKSYMHQPDANVVGQTPPPDMVFVPGGGNIPSFYMGFTEECNLNYNTYLEWLKNVHTEFPDVYKQATPKDRDVSYLMETNDPFYKEYKDHPAFAYYLVTGVSWLQAHDYLNWKTDRLNEAILYELGIHDERDMFGQHQENNFNTEAYLAWQYGGVVKKELKDYSPYGFTRKVKVDDGILFTDFRLPTKAEWEHAFTLEKNAQLYMPNYKNPFSKKTMYPYGKDYYILRWANMYGLYTKDSMQQGFSEARSWNNKNRNLTGPTDYNVGGNHVANLEGNVQEWLLDIYKESPQQPNLNMLQYLVQNGFPVLGDSFYLDIYGELIMKDSLGGFSFQHFMYDITGQPIKTKKVTSNFFIARNLDTVYRTFADGELIVYKNYYNNDTFRMEFAKNGERVYKNNKGYYYLDTKPRYYKFEIENHNRVVKGGTWQNPDAKTRMPLAQNKYSTNIGFRCVMAYTSMPVKPNYKVKWK